MPFFTARGYKERQIHKTKDKHINDCNFSCFTITIATTEKNKIFIFEQLIIRVKIHQGGNNLHMKNSSGKLGESQPSLRRDNPVNIDKINELIRLNLLRVTSLINKKLFELVKL